MVMLHAEKSLQREALRLANPRVSYEYSVALSETMTRKKEFVHLQVHSEFSIEDSLLTVDEIVGLTKKDKMSAAAVTDVNNVFALVKPYQAAVKNKIKPIIGAEIEIVGPVESGPDQKLTTKTKSQTTYRLVLLCQNRQGYLNLSSLITKSYLDGQMHGRPRVHQDWLTVECVEGLIAIEPGSRGYSAVCEVHETSLLSRWFKLFPNRYYFGIHRLATPESRNWEIQLEKLCTQKALPIVALNAVCFADKQAHQAHEVRACIQAGKVLDALESKLYSEGQYWRSQEEMSQLFGDMPEALENSVQIAKRCNLTMSFG